MLGCSLTVDLNTSILLWELPSLLVFREANVHHKSVIISPDVSVGAPHFSRGGAPPLYYAVGNSEFYLLIND